MKLFSLLFGKTRTNPFRQKSGFTLLELLVVISIIGILIAMGAVAFATAQRKGRDARRTGDIQAMQKGFEQYYAANGEYDTCATMATDHLPGGLPTDPAPSGSYTCNADTTGYCVCATLDETDGGNASALPAGGATTCTFGTGDYYCLTNLQ